VKTEEKESDMNDTDLREANVAIVRRYIDAINAWDFDTKRALLAEDAVFEMPYAPEGFQRRIVGRDEIIAFVETIPAIIDAENLHDVRLETFSSDPGEIVAEYRSDMVIKPTNAPYRNEYVSRFTVRDGRITRFAEYYDPIRLVVALGGSVRSGGIETAPA
jgi:ketosteroid isomerase-like protein